MPPKGESPPTVSQPTHIWSDSSGREAQENVAKRSTEPKGGIMLDPNLQALLSKQAYVQALEETGRDFTPGYNSQTELLYKSLYERWVEEGVTLVDEGLDDDDHFSLLDIMKHLVEHQGTNPYLTKDARMSTQVFKKSYSQLEDFLTVRKKFGADNVFHSLQSKRLGI